MACCCHKKDARVRPKFRGDGEKGEDKLQNGDAIIGKKDSRIYFGC